MYVWDYISFILYLSIYLSSKHLKNLNSYNHKNFFNDFMKYVVLRESIPRQVDKKSGVPEEEKGVPSSQGGDRVWSSQGEEKDMLFFYIALS